MQLNLGSSHVHLNSQQENIVFTEREVICSHAELRSGEGAETMRPQCMTLHMQKVRGHELIGQWAGF